MFSSVWSSVRWSAHLLFRIGHALGLAWVALFEWLKLFPSVDKWLFGWLVPRLGLVLLGALATPLPPWVLVVLMFVPPGVFAMIIFFAFLGAFIHF